jgi:hypothetical protein
MLPELMYPLHTVTNKSILAGKLHARPRSKSKDIVSIMILLAVTACYVETTIEHQHQHQTLIHTIPLQRIPSLTKKIETTTNTTPRVTDVKNLLYDY